MLCQVCPRQVILTLVKISSISQLDIVKSRVGFYNSQEFISRNGSGHIVVGYYEL